MILKDSVSLVGERTKQTTWEQCASSRGPSRDCVTGCGLLPHPPELQREGSFDTCCAGHWPRPCSSAWRRSVLREGTEDDRKGAPPSGGSRTGVQEGQEQESRSRSREALWSITGPGSIPKACWVLCKDAYLCPTLMLFSWTCVSGIHESLSLELFYALSDPQGSHVSPVTVLLGQSVQQTPSQGSRSLPIVL